MKKVFRLYVFLYIRLKDELLWGHSEYLPKDIRGLTIDNTLQMYIIVQCASPIMINKNTPQVDNK